MNLRADRDSCRSAHTVLRVAELTIRERHTLAEDGKPTALKFGESTGDRYHVRAIAEGDGSSGHYGKPMLKRDFAAALPEGSRMRANHDGLCEDGGDIRRVIGRTISTPKWENASENGPAGMYVDILVSEQWSSYVREFGDIIGLSISMAGDYEDVPEGWIAEGPNLTKYNDEGVVIASKKRDVIHLYSAEENPYNSLDFVEAPGADGRIVAALESARAHLPEMNVREAAEFAGAKGDRLVAEAHNKTSADQAGRTEEDIEVDEQTLRQMLDEAQRATLDAVKSTIAEASKPAEGTTETPTLATVSEAVSESGLSTWGRKAVYAAIERGESHTDAIALEQEREKGMRDEFAKAQEADVQHGYVLEAGDSLDLDEGDDVLGMVERATGRGE